MQKVEFFVPDILLTAADLFWNTLGLDQMFQFALQFQGGPLGLLVRAPHSIERFRAVVAYSILAGVCVRRVLRFEVRFLVRGIGAESCPQHRRSGGIK